MIYEMFIVGTMIAISAGTALRSWDIFGLLMCGVVIICGVYALLFKIQGKSLNETEL